jgi:hypothetical protein
MRPWSQILAGVMLVTSACSYTFTIGPHEQSLGGTPATCTTSRVPPAADTMIAVATGLAAMAAIYACEQSGPEDDDQSCIRAMLMAPPAAAMALVFAMSAKSGFDDTEGCEQDHALTARTEP